MRSEVHLAWRENRAPLERTLAGLVVRAVVFAVILLLLRWSLLRNEPPWVAYVVALLVLMMAIHLLEGAQFRRRQRAQRKEAEFRAWMARLNKAGSKRFSHNFDFNGESKLMRSYFADGLTPEQALDKEEREL